ncbi:MAG TPA: MBL fold metallo-hydrolase [Thermoanaerobaculaceae bacterium]|nr:MBL fold metallo-hydrolase [Thermoanaerobaculaceae bacterium]
MDDTHAGAAIEVLDLEFKMHETIASFLLRSDDGPVLIETGPESTFEALRRALGRAGFRVEDVRHALVTHIHLDHAGAAWRLAEHGATIYVHPVGAPHLVDPARLLVSARKIYGPQMDSLWGRMGPIAADRVRVLQDAETLRIGGLRIEALFTPGHASHHVAYRIDGAVLTGDIAGVRIGDGPVVPPCPPPEVDIEAWRASLARLREVAPRRLYLTHFGVVDEVGEHLDQLDAALDAFASWTRARMEQGLAEEAIVPLFEAYTDGFLAARGAGGEVQRRYAVANPAFMSVAGLARYWRKRAERAAAASA